MTDYVDPLVGSELVSVDLHAHHIFFSFTQGILQVSGRFTLHDGMAEFVPGVRQGPVQLLWPLIGCTVTRLEFACPGPIQIEFDEGTILTIPEQGHPRGTIRGNDTCSYDDF